MSKPAMGSCISNTDKQSRQFSSPNDVINNTKTHSSYQYPYSYGISTTTESGISRSDKSRNSISNHVQDGHHPCGLINLGNTCYMNSILQCLNSIQPLVEYYSNFKSPDSRSKSKHSMSQAFVNFIQSTQKGKVFRPDSIKSALSEDAPQLHGYGQQDSHECLTFLLEGLHQETSSENQDGEEQSIITDLFQGQIEYTIKCSAASRCGDITISREPFLDLPTFIDDYSASSCWKFNANFVSLDGKKHSQEIPVTSKDTIHSIINLFPRSMSNSRKTNIIPMKISKENASVQPYESDVFLSDVDEKRTVFYEVDDFNENSLTLCLFYKEFSPYEMPTYCLPPLLLNLDDPNYTDKISAYLMNYMKIGTSEYEILSDWNSNNSRGVLQYRKYKTIQVKLRRTPPPTRSTSTNLSRYGNNSGRMRPDFSVDLKQCLINNIRKVETTSSEDKWFCKKCHKERTFLKENRILSLPQILIIHFKRFNMDLPAPRSKIDTYVKYPLELDMKEFISTETSDKLIYDLISVNLHFGSLNGGHYIAYVKNGSNWFSCNDSYVKPMRTENVIDQNAYILFYSRRT